MVLALSACEILVEAPKCGVCEGVAEFNIRITFQVSGGDSLRVNGVKPPLVTFEGSVPEAISLSRVSQSSGVIRTPIYESVTTDNPAYTSYQSRANNLRRCVSRAQDLAIAGTYNLAEYRTARQECYTFNGFPMQGSARDGEVDTSIYPVPPRTVTETRIVRYVETTVTHRLDNRRIENGDTVVYVLKHRSSDTLVGRWPRGSTFPVTIQGVRYVFTVAQDVDFGEVTNTVGSLFLSAADRLVAVPVQAIEAPPNTYLYSQRRIQTTLPNTLGFSLDDLQIGRSVWCSRHSEESEEFEDTTVSPSVNRTRSYMTIICRYAPFLMADSLLRSSLHDEDGRVWQLVGVDRVERRRFVALRCERVA